MADSTNPNFDPTTYDPQVAQAILKQKQALAMSLMNSQNPDQGHMVPGGPAGFYVPPSKYGALSAAMQKLMGAYALKQANQDAQQQSQNQTAGLVSAYNNVQSPGTVDGMQATGSSDGLNPIQVDPTHAQAMTLGANGSVSAEPSQVPNPETSLTPKTSGEQMGDIMQLAKQGPVGQAIASNMLTPHEKQFLQNPNTGQITAMDKITGQPVSTVPGSGGNPRLVQAVLGLREQINPNTDQANGGQGLKYLNAMEQQAGMPLSTYASLGGASRGNQSTPTQVAAARASNADAHYKEGPQTADTISQIHYRDGPQTNATNAGAASTNVNTVKNQGDIATSTGAEITKAATNVAEYNNLADQSRRIQVLAQQIAGKYGSKAGSISAYLGNNNESATDRQLLQQYMNNQTLMSIAADEGGTGRGPNASLYKGYGEHGLDASSTPSAIGTMAGLNESLLKKRASAEQYTIDSNRYARKIAGIPDTQTDTTSNNPFQGH